MTKREAVIVIVNLLNRLTLNPAEAAGVNAALEELKKDIPMDAPPEPPQ